MKKTTYLEHVNFTVKDLEATTAFIQLAIPEFKIRGGGESNGRKWIHIGTEHSYLALNEKLGESVQRNYTTIGFNHFGFVVSNVEDIAERLLQAGFKRSYDKQYDEFRIRDYFYDAEGNEYEFVQYLSDNPEERNAYND